MIIDKLDYYVCKNIENKPQIKKKYIDAVIPFSIKLEVNKKISLYKKNLKNIIKNLKDSNQIRNIYLLTDSNILIDFVSEKEFDVIVPYLRSNDIDETLLGVMEDFISNTHFSNNVSFLIVYINSTDCDTNNTYEKLCDSYNLSDNSSAVVAKKNSGMFFKKSQGVFYKLDEQLGRYKGYKHPIYEVIESRGYIVHVNNLREGFLHKHDVLVIE